MRPILLISSLGFALIACAAHPKTVGTTTITSAPIANQRLTLNTTSKWIAEEVCKHEVRCGHSGDVSSCVDATVPKATEQLTRWNCEPAAVRARLKECLEGLNEQVTCEASLETRKGPLCPPNVACGDRPENMIPTGAELAKIWE